MRARHQRCGQIFVSGKESAPRAYELKLKIAALHQDGTSISAYYTRLRSLWDEIQSVFPVPQCTCNGCTCDIGKRLVERQEKEKLYEFLTGLDHEFGVIKTQILATKPTPGLGTAYHLVAKDERQRVITEEKKPAMEAAAFKASVPFKRENTSSSQHKPRTYPKPSKQEEEVKHCTKCDRDGHDWDSCFKRIGYPDWWPGKAKVDKGKPKASHVDIGSSPVPGLTMEQYNTFLKHFEDEVATGDKEVKRVANMTCSFNDKDDWVVDSGATDHTACRDDILINCNIRGF